MMTLLKILNLYILLLFIAIKFVKSDDASSSGNTLELEFIDEGVLRKDGDCNIIFTNFGMDKYIKGLTLKKTKVSNSNLFNLKIKSLVNGNMGPNNTVYLDPQDLKNAVIVKQNDIEITDFVISNVSKKTGLMDLEIKNLSTCEGLALKQTFIEPLVKVANRLYYENVVPTHINQSFDAKKFGPSYSYPFERIHWKINEGLDDLRETCGIYILFKSPTSSNGNHWQYYLSVENVNSKKCSQNQFFEVLKRNYIDYHFTEELLGENFMGYVLKREGHIEEHMDGIIVDRNYLVEIYLN